MSALSRAAELRSCGRKKPAQNLRWHLHCERFHYLFAGFSDAVPGFPADRTGLPLRRPGTGAGHSGSGKLDRGASGVRRRKLSRVCSSPGRVGVAVHRATAFSHRMFEHPEAALRLLQLAGARLRRPVGIVEELSFSTVFHPLISWLLKRSDGREAFALGNSWREI